MSWRATSWAAEQKTGSPISKLVLLKLADNANDEGVCWPSLDTIADHTELARRTVQDHLARLERMQLIQVELRTAANGASLANRYLLAMPVAGKKARGEGAPAAPHPAAGAGEDAQDTPGRVQPAASHIEEPSFKPTIEPPTKAPAAAGEGENVAMLGKEDLHRWPEFRSAIASTWPGGFPSDDEHACRKQFGKLTRSHPVDQLIECARAHGQAKTKQQALRPASAGTALMKLPSNWLRDGAWQGYQAQIQEQAIAESKMVTALGNVRRSVGPKIWELFQHQLQMPDLVIASLDGITFDQGPPPAFTVTTPMARMMLDRQLFALQRVLGDDLRIELVKDIRAG